MGDFSDNAIAVYNKLYIQKTEYTYIDVINRVSKFVSNNDKQLENEVKNLLSQQYFIYNSPLMMNGGYYKNAQNSACFVGSIADDLMSIFQFDMECGLIYKEGSGIGINFGVLRETNCPLSSGGNSSGPFAFIRKSASTCWAVKSGGRSRRAAFMCMFYDHHPDLIEFINFKNDHKDELIFLPNGVKEELFSCMNFSVAISNKFMKAVKNADEWNLIGVVDKQIKKTLEARDVFHQIASNAHKCGDPGVWFIDIANEDNTLKNTHVEINACNPCGEQPLHPFQSCALSGINLGKCITPNGDIDWELIKNIVYIMTETMDNTIDKSGYPTKQYREMAINTRPIGNGFMALADLLIKLKVPYDSPKAFGIAEQISKFITKHTIIKSALLAKEKGPFPLYEQNKKPCLNVAKKFFDFNNVEDTEYWQLVETYGLRNSQWTTCQPSGTTSIACDCSSGIEPLFALCYEKVLSDTNEIWTFINPDFERWLDNSELDKEKTINDIIKNHGSIQNINYIPQYIKDVFLVAHDIDWKSRLSMQAHIQRGISTAISSTINLSSNASVDDIKAIYMKAYDLHLKGVTVYRDKCKSSQPVNFGKVEDKNEDMHVMINKMDKAINFTSEDALMTTFTFESDKKEADVKISKVKKTRPIKRSGDTIEINTPQGKLYVTCNFVNGKLYEIFLRIGKQGSLMNMYNDTLARACSSLLQEGKSMEELVEFLRGVKEEKFWFKIDESQEHSESAESIVDAISKVIEHYYIKNLDEVKTIQEINNDCEYEECPECHRKSLRHDGGCRGGYCPICGYSKCG